MESPHPDWVSAVTSVMTGLVATGSYDGVARLWSVAQGRSVGDLVGHTAGALPPCHTHTHTTQRDADTFRCCAQA